MGSAGHAWRAGEDVAELSRQVRAAHDRFVATGLSPDRVRPLVAASWQRCLKGGIDPERCLPPVELLDDELEQWRTAHPLAGVMPVIRRLLVDDATEAGLLVAVSDAAGRLLWVEGSHAVRSAAESMRFMAGTRWSEEFAGTNAPGTALALDQPVQIFSAEHLARPVTAWSCSAAPIHDPDTGAVLGALDVTGGDEVAAPHALALVRATVAAVEGELRLARVLGTASAYLPAADVVRLQALAVPTALLRRGGSTHRLSLRHAELLLLLAAHPDGISGEQLAVGLHEHDLAAVTLRAELSRLRPLLAPAELRSRPYRLDQPIVSDADDVRALLSRGEVGTAVERYRGPLLPASDAPGIIRLRRQLHEQVRAAALACGDPDALLRLADTEHSRLDFGLWQAAATALPRSSPRREQVLAHLAYLDVELGQA